MRRKVVVTKNLFVIKYNYTRETKHTMSNYDVSLRISHKTHHVFVMEWDRDICFSYLNNFMVDTFDCCTPCVLH